MDLYILFWDKTNHRKAPAGVGLGGLKLKTSMLVIKNMAAPPPPYSTQNYKTVYEFVSVAKEFDKQLCVT